MTRRDLLTFRGGLAWSDSLLPLVQCMMFFCQITSHVNVHSMCTLRHSIELLPFVPACRAFCRFDVPSGWRRKSDAADPPKFAVVHCSPVQNFKRPTLRRAEALCPSHGLLFMFCISSHHDAGDGRPSAMYLYGAGPCSRQSRMQMA